MNAKEIFESTHFSEGEVTIKSFGDKTIKVRELSARQMSKVAQLVETDGIRSNALAVAFGCIDDSGKRIFTDNQVDKILDTLRITDITAIAEAIMKLSQEDNVEEK